MQYRRFGRTELQMPVFSCGGMRYQESWKDIPQWQISQGSQHNVNDTIKRSIELGINHIETARGYGTSEVQLGQILPTFPRDQIIVQTKVNPQANAQEFLKTVEKSLVNLNLNYIDLLGIHGINNDETLSNTIRPGGCLEMARKLQRQGKVRFVGFSTHGPTDIICQAINTGEFDYVNLHWYYINQFNWPAIEAATRHDMGVFIISPSNKGGNLYDPPQKLVELCAPLSPMVFNDLFCLSHPQVHTLSLGAAKPSDFDEHLKVLPLINQADELLSPILQRLEAEAIRCLGEEWYHTWHVGLPKPEDTPGQLNLHVILWLRNLTIAYDMIEYGKMRYNLLGGASHWFPGNRLDPGESLDLSHCLRHSPHADKIPEVIAETHALLGGAAVKRLSQQ